ncbi:MAG: TonB-dependent receptor plug domain-containing protein [Pseudomonadota bacterium]|nr:TonB-dependent receptor plug domain-containing protein [Pseudomonadota bacterium]
MQLPPIEVTERYDSLIGIGDSATEGTVGPEQIESRPLLRPGEVLETVPGVIVTQHSGAGKANQFYLRGFNLDHGTDFATSVAGIPVNFPTHAHG